MLLSWCCRLQGVQGLTVRLYSRALSFSLSTPQVGTLGSLGRKPLLFALDARGC